MSDNAKAALAFAGGPVLFGLGVVVAFAGTVSALSGHPKNGLTAVGVGGLLIAAGLKVWNVI